MLILLNSCDFELYAGPYRKQEKQNTHVMFVKLMYHGKHTVSIVIPMFPGSTVTVVYQILVHQLSSDWSISILDGFSSLNSNISSPDPVQINLLSIATSSAVHPSQKLCIKRHTLQILSANFQSIRNNEHLLLCATDSLKLDIIHGTESKLKDTDKTEY